MPSPIRFGLAAARAADSAAWDALAHRAEDAGYDVLHVPDHLGALSPVAAMQAAAAVTTRLRVGSFVFNNDFRNPLLLAQEAATIDLLSGGRLELGMGAGWNRPEYDAAGIRYDPASVRIARLEESVIVLQRLFAGEVVSFAGDHYQIDSYRLEPVPPQGDGLPVLIGGNGDRLLRVAARHANIIGFTGFTIRPTGPDMANFTVDGLEDRLDLVRNEAGERFGSIERNVLVQRAEVTNDAARSIDEAAGRWQQAGSDLTADDVAASPFTLIGTVEEIRSKILRINAQLGIQSFTVFADRAPGFDEVVASFS